MPAAKAVSCLKYFFITAYTKIAVPNCAMVETQRIKITIPSKEPVSLTQTQAQIPAGHAEVICSSHISLKIRSPFNSRTPIVTI